MKTGIHYVVAFIIWISVNQGNYIQAIEENRDGEYEFSNLEAHPLCGVLCLYSFALYNGINAIENQYINQLYVSNQKGSTMNDLAMLCEDHEIQYKIVKNLSKSFMDRTKNQVVLNVKRDPSLSTTFEHYMLYLKKSKDGYMIYEPPYEIKTVPFSYIAVRWNGVGMIVSKSKIDYFMPFQFVNILPIVILMVLGGIGIICEIWKPVRLWLECAIMGILLILCVVFIQAFDSQSLWNNRDQVQNIQEAYFYHILPKVTKASLPNYINDIFTLIIDARFEDDYVAGHLPRAINIPVTLPMNAIQEQLEGISYKSPMIIYCQSSQCPYARIVSRKIKKLGYEKIKIYSGGWLDWIQE